jgi:hypothetical protein
LNTNVLREERILLHGVEQSCFGIREERKKSMFTSRLKIPRSAALATILTLALGAHARADSAAVAITPDPSSTFNNGNGYSLGYSFEANSNITVTQLGYFADPTLAESHDVGLYTSTGILLASTVVTNADTLIANFIYNAITPVALTAGQDYVIMGSSGLVDPYSFNPISFSTDPSITYLQDGFAFGNGLAFPTQTDGPGTVGYFGPNFLLASAVVPEPSTLVLGGLAAMGGLLVGCRRRLP